MLLMTVMSVTDPCKMCKNHRHMQWGCKHYHVHSNRAPRLLVQGDRYSIAYFANVQATTKLQGPKKKYPPITFPDILAAKKKHRKSFMKSNDSDMTDDEYIEFQKATAIGPEFDDPNSIAAMLAEA